MTDAVSISIVTSVSAVLMAGISAYFAFRAKAISAETHKIVNSRMTEFMTMAEKSFKAEGVLQEKTDEKLRKAEVAEATITSAKKP